MASRILALRASRALLFRTRRPLIPSTSVADYGQARINPGSFICTSDQPPRLFSTSVANLPTIGDPYVLAALKKLMAVEWHEISEGAKDAVEMALTKKTDDVAGQEELKNAWRAAEAVEKFSGTLISLRMALDDLTGASGEKVRPLPPVFLDALKSALSRYNNYLAAFKEEEFYLKKKVEVELGSLLVHIRQRCAGLGPEWGNISLLGTSGLSGSFIEHRAN